MRAPLASMTGPGLISLTDLAVPLRRLRRADDAGIRLLQLADLRHLGATQLEWEAAEIFGKPFAFRRARDRNDALLFEEAQRHLRRRFAVGAADPLQRFVGRHPAAR